MRHILIYWYQSTSSSEYQFFFPQLFFLINFIITSQLHHNLSYLISFEPGIFWQLTFASKFPCCECWLLCIRLNLQYERIYIDNVYLLIIPKQIELLK